MLSFLTVLSSVTVTVAEMESYDIHNAIWVIWTELTSVFISVD